jgi:hypothetical protein
MTLFLLTPRKLSRLPGDCSSKPKEGARMRQEDGVMTEKPETGRRVVAIFFVLFVLVAVMMSLGG